MIEKDYFYLRKMGTNSNGHSQNGRLSSTAHDDYDEVEVDQEILEEDEEIFAQDRDWDQFDEIIGCIEDIVIEKKFQDLQESFLEENYHHFEIGTEENKLIYTEIFQVRHL